jgi:uncharacterized protein
MDATLDKIIKKIFEIITPDKIILFGSRAKNLNKEDSDYDILIIKSGIKNKREISKRIYRNLLGTNASVDIIIEVPEVIDKYKDTVGYIYKNILQEGKIIYGK